MLMLYGLLSLMLLGGLGLLSVPFVTNKTLLSKQFFGAMLFTVLFSLGFYQFLSHPTTLKTWLTQGREHYQLREKLEQLGGIDGVITRIQSKLAEKPTDAQGWFILGKLYLATQRNNEAFAAFAKAYSLQPNQAEIADYYQRTKKIVGK